MPDRNYMHICNVAHFGNAAPMVSTRRSKTCVSRAPVIQQHARIEPVLHLQSHPHDDDGGGDRSKLIMSAPRAQMVVLTLALSADPCLTQLQGMLGDQPNSLGQVGQTDWHPHPPWHCYLSLTRRALKIQLAAQAAQQRLAAAVCTPRR